MTVPWVAFSNAELALCPRVEVGDTIVCAQCGETHVLEDADPPGLLLFFSCGGKAYLAAVGGALVFGHQVDGAGGAAVRSASGSGDTLASGGEAT